MANWVYNTDHSSFLMKAEKINAAAEAVEKYIHENISDADTPPEGLPKTGSLEDAFDFLDLEYSMNSEGDIIDIDLQNSYWSSHIEKVLTEVIAPYVEKDSYLVFAFGEASGCWAIAYDGETATSSDVVTVLEEDLKAMLAVLKLTVPLVYQQMLKKYAPSRIREDLEVI